MAKNDEFLLAGILDAYSFGDDPNTDIGERFEFFSIEQVLKSKDLKVEEVRSGHTDGRIDGGVDAAYIFVNGVLYSEERAGGLPKSDVMIEVAVINCKHENAFREQTINTLIATTQDLFNFSIEDKDLQGRYNAGVLKFRRTLRGLYRTMAIYSPRIKISFYCITRGDTLSLGDTISDRAKQLVGTLQPYFRDGDVSCDFWGAAELLSEYRKTRSFTLEIPVVQNLSEDGKCFIALCKIGDYFKFLCDDSGNLRRYLLDANIRDYLGDNKVNLDIKATLESGSEADFWWLNNGVTILASSATIFAGKLIASNIRIINGLQTSQTIFNHF